MKRNDAEQIGKLIQQFLRQESLESPLNEQRLLDAWPQILGPAAAYTSNLYIRNQTRSYRNYKYYFSLRKDILSMTFMPSFRSVSVARS